MSTIKPPELWTPNRKIVAPSPLCPRCGRIDRRYYARNRQRMGFVYHRACCCKTCTTIGDCPSTIYATISGLDAILCGGCFNPQHFSSKLVDSAMDGTYGVSLQSSTSSECTYFSADYGGTLTVRWFYSTQNCTGVYQDYELSGMELLISVSRGDGKCARVNSILLSRDFYFDILPDVTAFRFSRPPTSGDGEYLMGDQIPNANGTYNCFTYPPASSMNIINGTSSYIKVHL